MFKKTKYGILSIAEIEQGIFHNVILAQAYVLRNYQLCDFSVATLCHVHGLIAGNFFDQAGSFRNHNVQIGLFEPVDFVHIPIEMKKLDDDIAYRLSIISTIEEKKEFLARVMRRILRIHPFFDYNARVTRLFGELFLLKQAMPLVSFRGKSRKEFAEAMKKATFDYDLSGCIALL